RDPAALRRLPVLEHRRPARGQPLPHRRRGHGASAGARPQDAVGRRPADHVRGRLTMRRRRVLILGASYGSLLASKLLLAGHDATLVCLPAEAELIEREGTRVRIPVRGREAPVLLDSRRLPGRLSAAVPTAVDPEAHDLVAL